MNAMLQKNDVQNFSAKGSLQASAVLLPELARYYSPVPNAESTSEPSTDLNNTNNSIAGLSAEVFKNKIIIDQNNHATLPFEFVEGKAVFN